MKIQMARRAIFSCALLGIIALLQGCLVASDTSQHQSGEYVPESTFSRIQPGKTTASWVKATLGDPSSKEKVEETNSEIWKYSYTEHRESSGAVFLIFAGHDDKETNGHAYVEIKDGVVVNKWRG